jgi:N utilization substance protein A
VINFTTNHSLYIARALSPARISSIKIDEENKTAAVYLKSDQVSLAIGRGGHNIKLAGKLTGYEIDVYRENDEFDEDVDIEEFSDEIESWVIDELKRVGLDSAKSVLSLSEEELVRRTDLEEDTVREIVRILQAEFE